MQEQFGTTPTPAKATGEPGLQANTMFWHKAEHECRAYFPHYELAGKVALSSSQADQDWEDYQGTDLSFLLSFQCANDA